MEYVDGLDVLRLMQAARRKRRIPFGLAAYVVQEVAKGLDYAHRSPTSTASPWGSCTATSRPRTSSCRGTAPSRSSDFGIAGARDVHEDEGVIKGKFAYMSPEQAAGRQVDRRSDVFSAGIVLYELSTGKPLFSHLRGAAALEAVKSGAIPRPRTVDPELPADLEEIILKTLAYHPDDRYQTARDLQQALLRVFYRIAIEGEAAMDSGALAAFASQVVPAEQRKLATQKVESDGTVVPDQPGQPARGRSPRREFAPPVDSDRVGTYVSSGHMPASTPAAGTPGRGEDSSELPSPRREVVSELRERKHVVVVEGRVGGGPWRDAQRDYLQVTEDIAYKHEAYCDRLEERGFTYIIGLPVSTEDDSGRAVKLALALCDAVRRDRARSRGHADDALGGHPARPGPGHARVEGPVRVPARGRHADHRAQPGRGGAPGRDPGRRRGLPLGAHRLVVRGSARESTCQRTPGRRRAGPGCSTRTATAAACAAPRPTA